MNSVGETRITSVPGLMYRLIVRNAGGALMSRTLVRGGRCLATTPNKIGYIYNTCHTLCGLEPLSVRPRCFGKSVTSWAHADLDNILSVGIEAAKRAGQVISSSFDKAKTVEHKGKVDLVTETDKACEALIFQYIKEMFPTHQLIGEETTAASGNCSLTDEPTWIVDPVDGTTNFVHRFPFVCVSIGVTIGKEPVVGVVYNPILDELFTAVKGRGAFLNGKPISVSSQQEIGKALLATEIGTNRDKSNVDATTNRIRGLLFKVRSVRMSGSCALNLCGIACGRLDLFYELGFGGPWDVAAGALIVQEAGGLVFDPSGGSFDLMSQRVAASNAYLKTDLVAALD